jgi:hypothetical protein
MPIYDLNDISFLQHDIENNLNTIDCLYDIKFKRNGNEYYPKTIVSKENYWTSEVCKTAFNNIVPIAKSLLKDMYAVLESYFKAKNGSFNQSDKHYLENKYNHLKELRLINNKFKHYTDSSAEITLTEMVIMESDGHHIDMLCNFNYKDGSFLALRLADLIDVYLTILEDQKVIAIHREINQLVVQ